MGIKEVIISVGDLDEAVEFYTRVVGCKVVRTLEDPAVVELDADGQRITLLPSESPGIHLVFPTEDAKRSHRRLKRREVPTRAAEPVAADGGSWIGFSDPWGNRLAFWEDQTGEDAQGTDAG